MKLPKDLTLTVNLTQKTVMFIVSFNWNWRKKKEPGFHLKLTFFCETQPFFWNYFNFLVSFRDLVRFCKKMRGFTKNWRVLKANLSFFYFFFDGYCETLTVILRFHDFWGFIVWNWRWFHWNQGFRMWRRSDGFITTKGFDWGGGRVVSLKPRVSTEEEPNQTPALLSLGWVFGIKLHSTKECLSHRGEMWTFHSYIFYFFVV